MFVGICYLVSLMVGTVAVFLQPGPHMLQAVAGTLLRFVLLLGTGIPLVVGGFGHVFQSDMAARRLGWPAGSPFQKELGFWDLAGGVGAMAAFWLGGDFRLAMILINSIFWILAGILHLQHVFRFRNYNADNSIPAVIDILVPVTLLVLYWIAH